MKVEPFVQDVFSSGFKVRTMKMTIGDTLRVKLHDIKKSYVLLAIVHGIEEVETPAGTFECFKVEPVMQGGRLHRIAVERFRVSVFVTYTCRRAVRWPRG